MFLFLFQTSVKTYNPSTSTGTFPKTNPDADVFNVRVRSDLQSSKSLKSIIKETLSSPSTTLIGNSPTLLREVEEEHFTFTLPEPQQFPQQKQHQQLQYDQVEHQSSKQTYVQQFPGQPQTRQLAPQQQSAIQPVHLLSLQQANIVGQTRQRFLQPRPQRASQRMMNPSQVHLRPQNPSPYQQTQSTQWPAIWQSPQQQQQVPHNVSSQSQPLFVLQQMVPPDNIQVVQDTNQVIQQPEIQQLLQSQVPVPQQGAQIQQVQRKVSQSSEANLIQIQSQPQKIQLFKQQQIQIQNNSVAASQPQIPVTPVPFRNSQGDMAFKRKDSYGRVIFRCGFCEIESPSEENLIIHMASCQLTPGQKRIYFQAKNHWMPLLKNNLRPSVQTMLKGLLSTEEKDPNTLVILFRNLFYEIRKQQTQESSKDMLSVVMALRKEHFQKSFVYMLTMEESLIDDKNPRALKFSTLAFQKYFQNIQFTEEIRKATLNLICTQIGTETFVKITNFVFYDGEKYNSGQKAAHLLNISFPALRCAIAEGKIQLTMFHKSFAKFHLNTVPVYMTNYNTLSTNLFKSFFKRALLSTHDLRSHQSLMIQLFHKTISEEEFMAHFTDISGKLKEAMNQFYPHYKYAVRNKLEDINYFSKLYNKELAMDLILVLQQSQVVKTEDSYKHLMKVLQGTKEQSSFPNLYISNEKVLNDYKVSIEHLKTHCKKPASFRDLQAVLKDKYISTAAMTDLMTINEVVTTPPILEDHLSETIQNISASHLVQDHTLKGQTVHVSPIVEDHTLEVVQNVPEDATLEGMTIHIVPLSPNVEDHTRQTVHPSPTSTPDLAASTIPIQEASVKEKPVQVSQIIQMDPAHEPVEILYESGSGSCSPGPSNSQSNKQGQENSKICGSCEGCLNQEPCNACELCLTGKPELLKLCKSKRCELSTQSTTKKVQGSKIKKVPSKRCRICPGCMVKDCGCCIICVKKASGESLRSNQFCYKKKCHRKLTKTCCGFCQGCKRTEDCKKCIKCTVSSQTGLCDLKQCSRPFIDRNLSSKISQPISKVPDEGSNPVKNRIHKKLQEQEKETSKMPDEIAVSEMWEAKKLAFQAKRLLSRKYTQKTSNEMILCKKQLIEYLNCKITLTQLFASCKLVAHQNLEKAVLRLTENFIFFRKEVLSRGILLKELHYVFENIDVSEDGITESFDYTKASSEAKAAPNNPPMVESVNFLAQEAAMEDINIILNYKTHSEWRMTVNRLTRNYVAVFMEDHVLFCPYNIRLPDLYDGYEFQYKMFANNREGKIYLPEEIRPANTRECHFYTVSNLEEYENHFLNLQDLQESSTLFKIWKFEFLFTQFDMKTGCKVQLSPTVLHPVDVNKEPYPDNKLIQVMNHLVGTTMTGLQFMRQYGCELNVSPPSQPQTRVRYVCLSFTDYTIFIPQKFYPNIAQEFEDNILCGQKLVGKDCKIGNTRIMKLSYEVNLLSNQLLVQSTQKKMLPARIIDSKDLPSAQSSLPFAVPNSLLPMYDIKNIGYQPIRRIMRNIMSKTTVKWEDEKTVQMLMFEPIKETFSDFLPRTLEVGFIC